MNTEHLSRGWALIAEGAQYISLAYASIDPPVPARETGVPVSPPAVVPEAGGAPSVSGPSFDELPPEEPFPGEAPPGFHVDDRGNVVRDPEPALNPQVEAGLGKCPVHGKPWSVKAAGVSKAGKPFESFWRCAEKDGDAWCTQKPQKIWRDLHPIPDGVAA